MHTKIRLNDSKMRIEARLRQLVSLPTPDPAAWFTSFVQYSDVATGVLGKIKPPGRSTTVASHGSFLSAFLHRLVM